MKVGGGVDRRTRGSGESESSGPFKSFFYAVEIKPTGIVLEGGI